MQRLGTAEKKPEILEMSPELAAVQDLMPMSDEDKERLATDIKKNGIRHPLISYNQDGKYFVLAGWHRRQIAIENNINYVPIEIIEATPKERRDFCINENLARRHLTTTQKDKLIDYLLNENPQAS